MSGFTLRPYQVEAADAAVDAMTNGKPGTNPIIVMPTGSGKSLVQADIAARLDGDTVIFQPNIEVLGQNQGKLRAYGIEPAIWSASAGKRERGPVTLATIGSVQNHKEAFQGFRNIIVDECHLVNAKGYGIPGKTERRSGMYRDFFDTLDGARILGLTATPFRLASSSWGSELRFITRTRPKVFTHVAYQVQIGELFRDDHLCPLFYRSVYAIDQARLAVNSTGSDFTDDSIRAGMDGRNDSIQLTLGRTGFNERLVDGVRRLLDSGRRHVVVFTRFARGPGGAQAIADEIGDVAASIEAKTKPKERRAILDAFKSGKVKVVTNVGIIALGFDFPRLDAVVLAAPTMSLGRYYQWIGRAVRTHPEKENAAIIDMCGNIKRFGRIEDLVLSHPPGKPDLWSYSSNGKKLTNVLMPLPEKQRKRAQYFAGRR